MFGSVKNPALGVNLRVRVPRWVKGHFACLALNLVGHVPITYSAAVTPTELSNVNATFRHL
jgi:hypothetical protein